MAPVHWRVEWLICHTKEKQQFYVIMAHSDSFFNSLVSAQYDFEFIDANERVAFVPSIKEGLSLMAVL